MFYVVIKLLFNISMFCIFEELKYSLNVLPENYFADTKYDVLLSRCDFYFRDSDVTNSSESSFIAAFSCMCFYRFFFATSVFYSPNDNESEYIFSFLVFKQRLLTC